VPIDVDVQDHVALITINRPERLNAMDPEHYAALSDAWIRVRDDGDIRTAIVTGAGEKSFTTGADLKAQFATKPPLQQFWQTQHEQLLNRGLEVWKPVIAAVNGYCLGGGMTLMLATDIRIAASHATFSLAEVKRGLIPANGGTQRISRQLPWPLAMEMLLVGDSISADQALDWQLINKVVPTEELLPTAFKYAEKIAGNAPLAVQAAKELATRSRDLDIATGLRLEASIANILRNSADASEGPLAFSEKRKPNFSGA
jgi:enoyl-CoA hydratase/carnithine racemase